MGQLADFLVFKFEISEIDPLTSAIYQQISFRFSQLCGVQASLSENSTDRFSSSELSLIT